MVKFAHPVEASGERSRLCGAPIGADIQFRDRRVVILQRSSVLAAVAEAAASHKNASALAEVSRRFQEASQNTGSNGCIDGAMLISRHGDVTVGLVSLTRGIDRPVSDRRAGGERNIRRVHAPVEKFSSRIALLG